MSEDEKAFLDKSRSKVKKIRLIRYSIYFLVIIAILYGGYLWQDKRYNDIKKKADNYMIEAKYEEAKDMYDQALKLVHWHISTKNIARDSIDRCIALMGMEEPFKNFKNEGDSLFNLGVSHYRDAFARYKAAKETGYNSVDIRNHIAEKTKFAIEKLAELAIIEFDAGHIDIATDLISEAYVIGGKNNEMVQINDRSDLIEKIQLLQSQ
jgi:tetratricopeptide (TPR) repeat protein